MDLGGSLSSATRPLILPSQGAMSMLLEQVEKASQVLAPMGRFSPGDKSSDNASMAGGLLEFLRPTESLPGRPREGWVAGAMTERCGHSQEAWGRLLEAPVVLSLNPAVTTASAIWDHQ